MPSTSGNSIVSIGRDFPNIGEKSGPTGRPGRGWPVHFNVPVGPPLLVDSATYKHALFIAPCDGCRIKELWLTGAVKIASGTNTIAFEKYDASANAGVNALSTTNIDPDTITATEGLQLTLTTTAADLLMDEGDVLWCTLVAGTQGTAGQGYLVSGLVIVPDVI